MPTKKERDELRESCKVDRVKLIDVGFLNQLLDDLDAKDEALKAWLHQYAPEFCKKKAVKEYHQKIRDAGGTIAFIGKAIHGENK